MQRAVRGHRRLLVLKQLPHLWLLCSGSCQQGKHRLHAASFPAAAAIDAPRVVVGRW
jgi:hypothetical protein